MLSVSQSTIYLWADNGILQSWKTPGGHRRIALDSINQVLRNGTPGKPANNETLRILIVEDEQAIRESTEAIIGSWGLPVTIFLAENGFSGLIEIGRQNPDLILTDLQMPGTDGFAMLQAIRDSSSAYKIIVITGLSSDDIASRGGIPPDIAVMQKPIDFEALRQEIATLCDSKKTSPAF